MNSEVSPDWYFGGYAALWAKWRSEGRCSFLFWSNEPLRSAAHVFTLQSKHLFFFSSHPLKINKSGSFQKVVVVVVGVFASQHALLCVFLLCFWNVPVCPSIKNPNVELKCRAEQVPGGAGAAGCSATASCTRSLQIFRVCWCMCDVMLQQQEDTHPLHLPVIIVRHTDASSVLSDSSEFNNKMNFMIIICDQQQLCDLFPFVEFFKTQPQLID